MALTRPKVGQINTVVTAISDPIAVLNNGSTVANSDVGFVLNRSSGIDLNAGLFWQESTKKFVAALTDSTGAANTINVLGYADVKFGNLIVTGGVYADQLYSTDGTLALESITNDLSILTANAASQATSITALQSTAADQQNQITSLGTAITTANTAIKGYVDDQITTLINGAPGTLDTLKELADALTGANDTVASLTTMIGEVQANVIIANTAMQGYVDQTVSSNISVVTSSIGVLSADLTTEIARATGVETALTSNIAELNSRVDYITSNIDPAAIDSITEIVANAQTTNAQFAERITVLENRAMAGEDSVAAEANARMTADTILTDNLAQEIARATTAEANLNSRIDSVLSNIDPAVIDSFTEVVSELGTFRTDLLGNITAETQARIAADDALTSDVANLNSRIDYITSNIDPAALDSLTEIVDAFQSSDADLVAAIESLGTGADSALAAVEAELQAQIDTINNKYVKYTFQNSQIWTVSHSRNTTNYMEKITDLNGNRMYATINNITNNGFDVVLTEAMSGSVEVFFG